MRVVSWNVNGIRACVRHGFVDFVDRSGADIVGVQEVRARPEDIPPAARRPSGWHTAFAVAERRGAVSASTRSSSPLGWTPPWACLGSTERGGSWRRWCTDPAPSVSHDRPPGHRGDSRCMIST